LGCLLVHGFTGTPGEMRPLGDALAARGFPVLGVRLAGHGTDPYDLAQTRWRDWYRSVEDGAARLLGTSPRLAVAGMSMGSLLALHLAVSRPDAVTALVLCGTALRLTDPRARWLELAGWAPWITRRWMLSKTGGRDIADPVMRASSSSYVAMPLASVIELVRLQRVVRGELSRVVQPALLLHGRHDHSVPVSQLDELRNGLGSTQIETHVLEQSWHVITTDVERAEVGRMAADFLDRVPDDRR
jgi:carboxylesterase